MRRLLLILALTLITPVAFADHYADFYVIPVSSHTPGQNGTMWMSDIAIYNFSSAPLTVQLVVVESGASTDNVFPLTTPNSDGSVTVPAGGSVLLRDVLNGHRGMSSTSGAILVGADRPFAVTSRSYSMAPSGDTVGQTVTPARDFLDNTFGALDPATAVAYIPGLINSNRFRSNLGMVVANGSEGETMGVTLTLRDAAGQSVGTRAFAIAPGALMHMQFAVSTFATRQFDIGSAEFRITQGTGSVVPYASVIDNNTADAVFVLGQFPDAQMTTSSSSFLFRKRAAVSQ